ncbi:MAG: hypothetical protein ABFS35_14995 [Bacteroidota bacterium]
MLDFTLETYKELLTVLESENYKFQTFEKFVNENSSDKIVILRHDVDRAPANAVKMALLENDMGISASYFFRIVDESYDEKSIRKIVDLNHELGYHYEDLALANGNFNNALISFENNLEKFRKFYPVKTMCMHGSPMSKWDNRKLWEKFNYKDCGISAEPYFDLNFDNVFYLTDASRSWNNEAVTLRDKVPSKFDITIRNTYEIVKLLKQKKMPNQLMISTHPHNWAANGSEWLRIKVWQGAKNQVKKILVKRNG